MLSLLQQGRGACDAAKWTDNQVFAVQLEVLVASLITVSCWRGAWTLLRPFIM